MKNKLPLVVDLDGTFIRTDSLHELLTKAIMNPKRLLIAVYVLITDGKAAFKRYLADSFDIAEHLLPRNQSVAEFLKAEKSQERNIILVTGADQKIADNIDPHHYLFTEVIGSNGRVNLTGNNKRDYLVKRFGEKGYDYIGNSKTDIPIWKSASNSFLATSFSSRTASVSNSFAQIRFNEVFVETQSSTLKNWIKELRVHQSLKNILLFLPLVAAHELGDFSKILLLCLGFLCFTAVAFSVYLLNDIIDIDADRVHARKKNRPIAAGAIDPITGLIASLLLAMFGIFAAFLILPSFGSVIITYLLLTISYTFWLKKIAMLDVIFLGLLYMIRIAAGAILADVTLSFWFTGIALFLFISLAIAKRYSEIVSLGSHTDQHNVPGRGYELSDSSAAMALGVSTGIAAVLIFTVYIQTNSVKLLYPSNNVLWFAIPVLMYWIGNLWLTAGRNELNDDPVIFAIKNKKSLIAGIFLLVIFVLASSELPGDIIDSVLSR